VWITQLLMPEPSLWTTFVTESWSQSHWEKMTDVNHSHVPDVFSLGAGRCVGLADGTLQSVQVVSIL
jgi:hypothetical protein